MLPVKAIRITVAMVLAGSCWNTARREPHAVFSLPALWRNPAPVRRAPRSDWFLRRHVATPANGANPALVSLFMAAVCAIMALVNREPLRAPELSRWDEAVALLGIALTAPLIL
jgi:hypothetical protein